MVTDPTPTPAPTAAPPEPDRPAAIPPQVRTVLAILMSSAFVMMLNETTVAVALPAVMADFRVDVATAQWLLTGFLLTMAVVMPTTGWMLERFTTRSVFVAAIASFLTGTVLAALAPTFAVLLLGRIGQGMGTAILLPLMLTVTMTLVPASRRGSVMGLIAVVMAVGPALGPTFAGAVLAVTTWHGIFWIVVPLVALAGILGLLRLTDVGTSAPVPLDVLSVLLSVVAFGGLVYGLSSIEDILAGGTAGEVALGVTAAGVLGLALFVWRQMVLVREDRALLDLRPLAVRGFTIPLIVLLVMFAGLLGIMNTLPLYLQGSLLVTALATGLALLPGGLVETALSPVAGRLFDRIGPRPLIITGMVISTGALAWLSTVDETTSVVQIALTHVVFSVGLAACFSPLMTTALGSLPAPLYGHGSAILNTSQQLAGAAGTAAMIAIYGAASTASRTGGASEVVALAHGAHSAFLAGAITVGAAGLLSLFISAPPARVATGAADVPLGATHG